MEETPPPGILAISRRGLLKSGLIAGLGVAGLSAASTALTTGVARASVTTSIYVDPDYDYDPLNPDWETATVQTEWAYCVRCRNLYYAGEGGSATFGGACAWDNYLGAPNTPHYSPSSSTNYGVMITDPGALVEPPYGYSAYLQNPWYWCSNCYCLCWGEGQAESYCAANYTGPQKQHVNSGSGVYYMPYGTWYASGATVQPGWKYCTNCKCLYWGNELANSLCQRALQSGDYNGATGQQHAPGGSVYTVFMM